MTLIDYFIIAILLISAGLGFMRGFFREITLLLSWIISLWLATHFAYLIEPLLAPWVVNEKIRKILAYILIGMLTFAAGALISFFLKKWISGTFFAPIDRMLGIFFGAVRGAFILGCLVTVALQFKVSEKPFWQVAKMRPMAEETASLLNAVVGLDKMLSEQITPVEK